MNKPKEQPKVTSFYKYKLNYKDHLIYIYKNWLLLVVLLVYSFHFQILLLIQFKSMG